MSYSIYSETMNDSSELPLFLTIPHSGEKVPPEVNWLQNLPEPQLMRDVDRFVDKLYQPSVESLELTCIYTPWHRYVVDLNRKVDEYDADSVVGAPFEKGLQPKGLHWVMTTHEEKLIPQPMTQELHDQLVKNYYEPFHDSVRRMRENIKSKFGVVYHLDLHSMPSLGTSLHQDPGQERPEIVVSDFHGKKSGEALRDLVMEAYQKAGFQVGYNWPYVGGGITQTYGDPEQGFHTVQIEMNRSIYMNEETKKLRNDTLDKVQNQLKLAMKIIQDGVGDLVHGK